MTDSSSSSDYHSDAGGENSGELLRLRSHDESLQSKLSDALEERDALRERENELESVLVEGGALRDREDQLESLRSMFSEDLEGRDVLRNREKKIESLQSKFPEVLEEREAIRVQGKEIESPRMKFSEVLEEREALRDQGRELESLQLKFSEVLEEREALRDQGREFESLQLKFSEVLEERNVLQEREDEFVRRIDEGIVERERILKELEEKSEKVRVFSEDLVEIESVRGCLVRVIENIGGGNNFKNREIAEVIGLTEGTGNFSEGIKVVSELAIYVESKLSECKSDKIMVLSENLSKIASIKECFVRIIESIDGENNAEMRDGNEPELVGEIGDFSTSVKEVMKLAIIAESKVSEYKEARVKEKSDKIRVSSQNLVEIKSIKECINRVIESIGGENNGETRDEIETELVEEISDFPLGLKEVSKLVSTIQSKVNDYKETREKDKGYYVKLLSDHFQKIKSANECLVRLLESINEENKSESIVNQEEEMKEKVESELDEEYKVFWVETGRISSLVTRVELKFGEYRKLREKEKRELESSVVSLTEENRDINTLLRVALAEKEAVERSMNRLKGNTEPKRGSIWGLPRVGLGFMMGTSEQASDNSSVKSDCSESEEEVVSLASTVERIMKNLRLEIAQLRRSLEESRSDTERLQSLTEKQAHMISENAVYIKELEDREAMLAQNVEELLIEVKETEEEVARWREACELEVEAGKSVVEERDKLVLILKQELEKTKAALEIANGKLKLKEDLANAAMAAQAAGERSLQLTDSRVSVLNARVEELTKQLEEAENKDKIRHKVRHICWPFRVLKVNSRNGGARNFKRMLPEMQALLH